MKKNVVYTLECLLCPEEDNRAIYYGESARATYERAVEHQDLIRRLDRESPIVEHHLEQHKDQQVSVQMKVVKKLSRPLERQALEGLLISEHKGGPLLNRKGEWGEILPPKFGILDQNNPDRAQKKSSKRSMDEKSETTETPSKRSRSSCK